MNHVPPSLSAAAHPYPPIPPALADVHRARGSVPGDRYFGRLLMSALEVRNSLRDLASRIDERHEEARQMFDEAVFVEDALRDWAQKCPNDTFLPYLIFTLATLYSELDTAEARARKDAVADWLSTSFMIGASPKPDGVSR
ncbi:MAG TPA: hypothetical protein VN224_06240 [Xanthomonadales bacterium]|nr:hypothetical protein [Xanthomonadales bacterium]